MQIGEVAGRVGLSLRTIRHWDEVGLVVPSERSAGGFRLYTEADVDRLMLVKTLKPLDLTLEQMRELVDTMDALAADDGSDSAVTGDLLGKLAAFRAAADGRVGALRAQIQGLEMLSRELRALAARSARSRRGEPRQATVVDAVQDADRS
ncbi:MerR family transcriptional regulator [Pseudonocardia nigra]|uniref:MerR family transcriptional regulator n=1 Tax=Pseudonocardia nigra TaxID=1921578 RepID=UPI001C5F3645|nr:MerR family transcriptional regulator [Pseudonocardia nigra]